MAPHPADIVLREQVVLSGLTNGEVIQAKSAQGPSPPSLLRAVGGSGPWYWFENAPPQGKGDTFHFRPERPGRYQILLVDQSGAIDRIHVEVYH